MANDIKNTFKGFSRRDILRFSLASAGIYALGPLTNSAYAIPENRKFVVLINLDGGNDPSINAAT